MDSLTIRPAIAADTPAVFSLIRELAEYDHLSHELTATESDIHSALFGPMPSAECVIAEIRGEPVGFALYFHNFSTFAGRPGLYLEDLYIKPEYRGKGFGTRLLSHLAQLAKVRGCARFEWAVLEWNQPAIRFYSGLGANTLSDWRINRLTGEALDKLAAEA